MVLNGFKLALGAALAVLLVWGLLDLGSFYGKCASTIDVAGAPPAGHACEWVGKLHKPRLT